jgi:hypothetical protein
MEPDLKKSLSQPKMVQNRFLVAHFKENKMRNQIQLFEYLKEVYFYFKEPKIRFFETYLE